MFAPLLQMLITVFGWAGAMWSLAVLTLTALPLLGYCVVRRMRRQLMPPLRPAAGSGARSGKRCAIAATVVARGLFHVRLSHRISGNSSAGRSRPVRFVGGGGELVAGADRPGQHRRQPDSPDSGCNRTAASTSSFGMYASRARADSRVPGRAENCNGRSTFCDRPRLHLAGDRSADRGVVGKLFGMRYLATLFGLTLLTHQIGAFFGAYLGGIAVTAPAVIFGCGTPMRC